MRRKPRPRLQRGVEAAYRRAGLEQVGTEKFGFFPPQLFNRSHRIREMEGSLEGLSFLGPILPFLLIAGCTPEENEA